MRLTSKHYAILALVVSVCSANGSAPAPLPEQQQQSSMVAYTEVEGSMAGALFVQFNEEDWYTTQTSTLLLTNGDTAYNQSIQPQIGKDCSSFVDAVWRGRPSKNYTTVETRIDGYAAFDLISRGNEPPFIRPLTVYTNTLESRSFLLTAYTGKTHFTTATTTANGMKHRYNTTSTYKRNVMSIYGLSGEHAPVEAIEYLKQPYPLLQRLAHGTKLQYLKVVPIDLGVVAKGQNATYSFSMHNYNPVATQFAIPTLSTSKHGNRPLDGVAVTVTQITSKYQQENLLTKAYSALAKQLMTTTDSEQATLRVFAPSTAATKPALTVSNAAVKAVTGAKVQLKSTRRSWLLKTTVDKAKIAAVDSYTMQSGDTYELVYHFNGFNRVSHCAADETTVYLEPSCLAVYKLLFPIATATETIHLAMKIRVADGLMLFDVRSIQLGDVWPSMSSAPSAVLTMTSTLQVSASLRQLTVSNNASPAAAAVASIALSPPSTVHDERYWLVAKQPKDRQLQSKAVAVATVNIDATGDVRRTVVQYVTSQYDTHCFSSTANGDIVMQSSCITTLPLAVSQLVMHTSGLQKLETTSRPLLLQGIRGVRTDEKIALAVVEAAMTTLRSDGAMNITAEISGTATVQGAVADNATVSAVLTVPSLVDTAQPTQWLFAEIDSWAATFINVTNPYSMAVTVQLADDKSSRESKLFSIHWLMRKKSIISALHDKTVSHYTDKYSKQDTAVLQPGDSVMLGPVFFTPQHCCRCYHNSTHIDGVFLRNTATRLEFVQLNGVALLPHGTACYEAEHLRQAWEPKKHSFLYDIYGLPQMHIKDELCKKQQAAEAILKDCYDY
jgi:hypothetical protein